MHNGFNKIEITFPGEKQLFRLQLPAEKKWKLISADSSWFAVGEKVEMAKHATVSWSRIEAFYPAAASAPVNNPFPDFTTELKKINNAGMIFSAGILPQLLHLPIMNDHWL